MFFLQFLVEQNDEFQKEKLQEDYNDSYLFLKYLHAHADTLSVIHTYA